MGLQTERVVVVTGASRGVGKGIALAMARPGDTVYITGRARQEGQTSSLPGTIDATAQEVEARGARAVAVACDHSDDAQIEALMQQVVAEQGRLDILVNNVFQVPDDLQSWQPFWKRPIAEHWRMMVDVGMRAHYVAACHAAPHMVEQRSGMIVNISSPGARAYLHSVIYGIGKAGADKMVQDMAKELKDYHVAAFSLWPGIVKTERLQPALEADALPADYEPLKPGMESAEFPGRIIDAIANQQDYMRFSGRAWWNSELAQALNVTDVDGNQPASYAPFMGSPCEPSDAMIT